MSVEALTYAARVKVGDITAKFVLGRLADRADERFSCFPSVPLIAAEAEKSERTIQRALAYLETLRLISTKEAFREDGSQTSNRFFLHGPWDEYAGTGEPFPEIVTPKQKRALLWAQQPQEGEFREGSAAAVALSGSAELLAASAEAAEEALREAAAVQERRRSKGRKASAAARAKAAPQPPKGKTAGHYGVSSMTPPPVSPMTPPRVSSMTPLEPTDPILSCEGKDSGVTAVGQSAGGFTRAGACEGAAPEIQPGPGGSAASDQDLPTQQQYPEAGGAGRAADGESSAPSPAEPAAEAEGKALATAGGGGGVQAGGRQQAVPAAGQNPDQPGPQAPAAAPRKRAPRKPQPISELRPVEGEAEVYALLDSLGVLTSPAARIQTLRKAVREFLGYRGAEVREHAFFTYPRGVEHAALRINGGWYRGEGPARSHPDYRGCSRCTASGCPASRDDCSRILKPVGFLRELLIEQACDLPQCERGVHLDTRQKCALCGYLARERALTAEAEAALRAAEERKQEAFTAQREAAHGPALEENARRDEAAAKAAAHAAAKVADEAETARIRLELAAEFAALDAAAGAGRAHVPAPLHPAHDMPAHDQEPPVDEHDEDPAPEDIDAAWAPSSEPSAAYQAWRTADRAHRDAARIAAAR
ncbi:helix-turn-helix domain-containing protein [Streptomyces sp. NPDC091204]|uniref:helix-turn-helix domain-containing protein n=1 Tax=Streptomyces sp. NPDC091204 TaxID=3155299 RepID=UPI00341A4700